MSTPAGDYFYTTGIPDQPMLLIVVGSGLAQLIETLRDASSLGHNGQIRLYHGSRYIKDLYLVHELRRLVEPHKNFS